MTLPYERTLAVANTKQLLEDLMDPRETPRIPLAIRERARRCLRHYPTQYDMERLQEQAGEMNGPG